MESRPSDFHAAAWPISRLRPFRFWRRQSVTCSVMGGFSPEVTIAKGTFFGGMKIESFFCLSGFLLDAGLSVPMT